MKINATVPVISYHALRGSYGKVMYFMTKTDIRDVAENLQLAPQDTLKFGERIQRKINMQRVERDLVPYLQNNELRFFNSLVCILLPDKENSAGFWDFEEYQDSNGGSLGGLGLLKVSKNVGRVVLDGQHRFEALKRYWNTVKDLPGGTEKQIEVGLLFIIIDELGKMGIQADNLRTSVLQTGRNLFAVLNKTAVSVDKNTLLLIDDSDICNVITRKILEEEVIADLYVKWNGALNLNPTDPYFTVIQVIQDTCVRYLRDLEGVDVDYGADDERQDALERLYSNTPKTEVPLVQFIREAIGTSKAFGRWKSLLKTNKVDLAPQPQDTFVSNPQRKALTTERNGELLFTVAGQKAAFRALIDAFYAGHRRDLQSLRVVMARLDAIFEGKEFVRSDDEKNPFLLVLFDGKLRMTSAERSVECARKILAVALGSGFDKKAVLEEFRGYTDRDPNILTAYWARVAQLLPQ